MISSLGAVLIFAVQSTDLRCSGSSGFTIFGRLFALKNPAGVPARCKINVGVFKEKDTRDCQKVIK